MKKIIIILLLIIIAVIVYAVYKKDNKSKDKLRYFPVKRGDVVESAIAIGQIVPEQDISVKSKIRGILKKKFVDVGDVVKSGMPLMEVNPDPTPLEYMQARRQMQIAKVALTNAAVECYRMEKLHKLTWASRQEYDDCKQLLDESKLRFEMAKENFDLISKGKIELAGVDIDNVIRSPISGMVLELLVDVGDPVVPLTSYQEGTPLMTVADMTSLIFEGTVDEIDVGKLKEGILANITIGALPDQKLEGIVSEISPKAKREANATKFDIEIQLCDTNITALRAGYSATAKIILAETNDVIVIPERLLFYSNDTSYVEISKNKETRETTIQPITTGLSDGMTTEIKTGLKTDDEIVERLDKKEK